MEVPLTQQGGHTHQYMEVPLAQQGAHTHQYMEVPLAQQGAHTSIHFYFDFESVRVCYFDIDLGMSSLSNKWEPFF